ncbi:unnamed protein product [Callosobruchus maculatus]|uniref:Uncharacterized protein n=1 Tax=Callosobruchus maculatus TaxID=64391 RepID=A0A653D4J3_CALMS|nr:unnamed protein product [Callosobruchus maculatus]
MHKTNMAFAKTGSYIQSYFAFMFVSELHIMMPNCQVQVLLLQHQSSKIFHSVTVQQELATHYDPPSSSSSSTALNTRARKFAKVKPVFKPRSSNHRKQKPLMTMRIILFPLFLYRNHMRKEAQEHLSRKKGGSSDILKAQREPRKDGK